jgi:hypothetical protein
MWGGIKRHNAKEFQKSTLANESCAIFKKWCENTRFNLSEIFFHKNFKRGKCESKQKEQAAQKWGENRQRCSRNTRQRAKAVKTVKKNTGKIPTFYFSLSLPHSSLH